MHIVLITTQATWHGGEVQLKLFAEGARRRGHHVSVIARRGSAAEQRFRAAGFATYHLQGRGVTPLQVLLIRRLLHRLSPDAVLFNDSHALTGGGLATWGTGIAARVMLKRVDFPLKGTFKYRHLCDHVVCVSQAVADICQSSGVPREALSVVRDGVDPARMSQGDRDRGRRSLGLDDEHFMILVVARLAEHKGHRYLLEAMPQIEQKFPFVRLAIAGEGDQFDALKQQSRNLGMDRHIRLLGHRPDVADMIQACDLYVQPSVTEGLCSSVIDVMLSQKAIVATTAGGIPELLGGETDRQPVAWLVPPGNPDALARAIIDAIESPEDRQALAKQARARALANFTADHMVDQTLSVIRRLVGYPAIMQEPPLVRPAA